MKDVSNNRNLSNDILDKMKQAVKNQQNVDYGRKVSIGSSRSAGKTHLRSGLDWTYAPKPDLELPTGHSFDVSESSLNGTDYERIPIHRDELDKETWILLQLCGFGEYEQECVEDMVIFTRGHPENDEPADRTNALPVIDRTS